MAHPHSGLQVDVTSLHPVRLQAQFDCAPGELVALVGASGSGKTTLLRCVAGLHRSDDLTGVVRLGDQIWMDSAKGILRSAQERRAGLAFQHYALFPHLDAINNIAICAHSIRSNGLNAPEKIALEWLQRLGLSDLEHRLPHELSGGQQQRIALARALVRIQDGGGVLLFDEPFSAVDAPMRQILYRELAQLRQTLRVPIVLVTHDLQEARRLADRIVIIDGGHTLQSGSPAQVMRSPRNARVAQLVGIHNHFHARFHRAQPGMGCLNWGQLRLNVLDKGKIDDDSAITWVLAGEAVQLQAAQDSPDLANNPLACILTEMLPLGEISLCRLAVQGTNDTIQLNLPTALLAQRGLQPGQSAMLMVPPDAVHIMPVKPS